MKFPGNGFIRLMQKKAGMPPGSLEGITVEDTRETQIQLISFRDDFYERSTIEVPETIPGKIKPSATNWIHITGLKNVDVLQQIGSMFEIPALIMEDVFNVEHLPKFDDLGHILYLAMNILEKGREPHEVKTNHVSMFLGKKFILSIAQHDTPIFDPFIKRIEQATGIIRQRGNDYIFYRLADLIIDHYFHLFENVDDALFRIEDALLSDQSADMVANIQHMKKELMFHKRNIYPVSEALRSIRKSENRLIGKDLLSYYSDAIDHLLQLVQSIDSYREMANNLMDLQLANNSNRMNDVMKTLTIIATIFIPLTFLAGIYGMNFQYMPELGVKWAYPALLSIMLILGLIMYFYMKRKRWF